MMKIYQSELKAGLSDAISLASVVYDTQILKNPVPADMSAASDNEDWDTRLLYRFSSVLASTGWNGNDDVFMPDYVWAARYTPVDKMVNMHHDHDMIVGHMTSVRAALFDGSAVDIAVAEYPEEFDIIVDAVLYRKTRIQEKNDEMETLIAEIENGDWCVSMECRFDDFHYMVIGKDGERGIITRNESTAFLTKHLRVYGGDGVFQDYKIGRVLADFSFSGKGLVKRPANKRSVILNVSKVDSSEALEESIVQANQLELNMKEELDKALAKATELEHEVKSLKDQLNAVVADNASIREDLSAAKLELDKSVAELKTRDAAIAKQTEDVKTLTEQLSVAQTELQAVQKERKLTERISKLVLAGVSEDEAKAITNKWESVSDEQFTDIVTLHKPAEKTPEHPAAADAEQATEKDADAVASASKDSQAPPNPPSEETDNLSVAKAWVGDILNKKGKK